MGDQLSTVGVRHVLAVAEHGSFGAAARECGLSQAALSNGVAKVEAIVGARLFHRSRNGCAPTALGRALIPKFEQVLVAIDAVQTEAARLIGPPPPPIRVGHSPLIAAGLISAAHRSLRPPPDGVSRRLDMQQADIGDLIDSVTAGERDLILIPSSTVPSNLRRRVVRTEPLVLIEPGRDARATDDTVRLDCLEGRHLILLSDTCGLTRFTRRLFDHHGLRLTPHLAAADSYRALEHWSEAGIGAALIPRSKLSSPDSPSRGVVDADGRPIEVSYEAVWHPAAELADEISGLVDAIVDHVGITAQQTAGDSPSAAARMTSRP